MVNPKKLHGPVFSCRWSCFVRWQASPSRSSRCRLHAMNFVLVFSEVFFILQSFPTNFTRTAFRGWKGFLIFLIFMLFLVNSLKMSFQVLSAFQNFTTNSAGVWFPHSFSRRLLCRVCGSWFRDLRHYSSHSWGRSCVGDGRLRDDASICED